MDLQDIVAKIAQLDLEPIVFKLTTPEKGRRPKMTLAEADRAVGLYRQFLCLCIYYPEQSIVPTEEIDEIWHTHILDTSKYRQDCTETFGRILDHFPYLGLRGAEDELRWHAAFAETCRLFMLHFGTELVGAEQACGESCGESLCENQACDSQACGSSDHNAHRERPRPVRA